MSLEESVTELKVNVAQLQTHYEYIRAGLEANATAVSGMNGKFDLVLQAIRDERARRDRMSKVWATISHAATGLITLGVAHALHMPMSFGG